MKKILLLGGSQQQVVAIETAKRLGYYTVLCDYLPDNPGQYVVDKFYLASTTDKAAILRVAEQERIDGVLAYASDPAAPTAAYVAEKMGLPGNPYKSVEILCNKDKFRDFLGKNGFNVPYARGYSDSAVDITQFHFPIIVKPVDSSGSKGVTVLNSPDGLQTAVDFAFSFSRYHRIIVEEFIQKKHEYLIGGDIFVNKGKVVVWGLLNCHRDANVNPLVPVGKSYPLQLGETDLYAVKEVLQSIVTKLKIKFCSMNVELVIDKSGKVFSVDMGPRAGGNMIPDLLGMIYGIDLVEMAVRVAMGERVDFKMEEKDVYYATHNLHSEKDGILKTIEFSDLLEKKIVKKCFYKKSGDKVECFDNAAKALGIIFMKFESKKDMKDILDNINDNVKICL